jgi:hypothetical protein
VACRHISRICSLTFTRTVLQKQLAKQIAKTKGMAIGHAFFTRRYSVFSSIIRVQPSGDPDSIPHQSVFNRWGRNHGIPEIHQQDSSYSEA